jgi:AcrR family transcriptional regulator
MPRTSDPTARIKLLAAAETEFVRHGLDGARVQEITRRAGLSKGAFYLHFESKDDAFRHLIEAMVARLATYIDACPVDEAMQIPTVDQFLDFWVAQDAAMFDFIWQNRGLVGMLLDGGRSAAYRHLVDEFAERAGGKTRLLLEAGARAGIYRSDLDLDVTCAFIGGAYDRMARQLVRERQKPDLPALLRQVQILFLRGIASPTLMVALNSPRAMHDPQGQHSDARPEPHSDARERSSPTGDPRAFPREPPPATRH